MAGLKKAGSVCVCVSISSQVICSRESRQRWWLEGETLKTERQGKKWSQRRFRYLHFLASPPPLLSQMAALAKLDMSGLCVCVCVLVRLDVEACVLVRTGWSFVQSENTSAQWDTWLILLTLISNAQAWNFDLNVEPNKAKSHFSPPFTLFLSQMQVHCSSHGLVSCDKLSSWNIKH